MSGGWQGLEGSAQGIDTRNAQGAGADARAVGPKMPRESRAGQRADFLGQALHSAILLIVWFPRGLPSDSMFTYIVGNQESHPLYTTIWTLAGYLPTLPGTGFRFAQC